MIGIFDSGVGGLVSFGEIRRLLPRADIIYLADRKNAPYGTKREEVLKGLVRADVQKLKRLGAEDILIACCTACTVYPLLGEDKKGALSIIQPTADYISRLFKGSKENARILVIATERTVDSKAFSRAINQLLPSATVDEFATQELVYLVESGARDGKLGKRSEEYADTLCERLSSFSPDCLVLGCTHFSHLEQEIKKRIPEAKILSPAKIGAVAFAESIIKSGKEKLGSGRSIYIE